MEFKKSHLLLFLLFTLALALWSALSRWGGGTEATQFKVEESARQPSAFVAPSGVSKASKSLARDGGAKGGSEKLRPDFSELNRLSQGRWRIELDAAGFAANLASASLSLGSGNIEQSARDVLERLGQPVFGVSINDLSEPEVRYERDTTQFIYKQMSRGLPVFGSMLSLFFNRDAELVYANSSLLHVSHMAPPSGRLSASAAASIAREELVRLYGTASVSRARGEGTLSVEEVMAKGQLGFRLAGASAMLVYRYGFLAAELSGRDLEIMVDASNGVVVVSRDLTRK